MGSVLLKKNEEKMEILQHYRLKFSMRNIFFLFVIGVDFIIMEINFYPEMPLEQNPKIMAKV